MEIVVTHPSADFDAFASAMAARALYPGSRAVMTRGLAPGVREFAALHKDRFPWLAPSDVDPDAVERLVLVDVRRASRLSDLGALLARAQRREIEVHVWDHHPAAPDDVPTAHAVIEPVGSAVTLLVEAGRDRGLAIDPVEATLYALGIHADTGSLQHAGTTPRDAAALAHLLERGASLKVMSRFLDAPFTRRQRIALAQALGRVTLERAAGFRVAMVTLELASPLEGLDTITSELFRIEQPHVLFLVAEVRRKRRAHVIARARPETIDVGAIARSLGGGGHDTAAAAARSNVDPDQTAAELRLLLSSLPVRPLRVAEIMSSPVRTIAPDHTLERLAIDLPTWGHTGVPVVRGGKLAGIISTDDVERASREGRLHLAASGFMSQPVHVIDASASIEEALELMTRLRVGRLPVLREGNLVGIVTRSDVRAVLYES